MRVVLVGLPSDRARLRAELNGSIDVVAEFASMAAAQRSDADADATMIAESRGRSGTPRDEHDDDGLVEEPLTPREIQVLELPAEVLPNKHSAQRLRLSHPTV